MSSRIVLGLDPSLNNTGFAYYSDDGLVTGRITVTTLRGVQRLAYVSREFNKILVKSRANLLAIEGYAFGYGRAAKGRVVDIGELGGILKLIAFRSGVDILIVPPASLKQFATGNGRADKKLIAKSIKQEYGLSFRSDDEADAFVLLQIGSIRENTRRQRKYDAIRLNALKNSEFFRSIGVDKGFYI